MSFQDVEFLPFRVIFHTHFSKIVVEVKASESPNVLKFWLGVSMSMLTPNQNTCKIPCKIFLL